MDHTGEQVIQLINQTKQNIFLTGRAGTGKTTLLKQIVSSTYKNYIIVAPTGVAAINAGGVTIHSMFQLPFTPLLPTDNYIHAEGGYAFETQKTILRHFKVRADKRALFHNLELLIIDEVSMLRPDTLDAINLMLQYVRYDKRPFGGVQVLFIGDLLQLPPIIRNHEWEIMSQYYEGKFFFHAKVLSGRQPLYIELTKIWRQKDEDFIHLLQKLRMNIVDDEVRKKLSPYVDKGFDIRHHPGYIILTTHNQQADEINDRALKHIPESEFAFQADVIDDFPENFYPIDKVLRLKRGAQVMFIKNDLASEKRYYNGKIGFVKSISNDELIVRFPEENSELEVDKFIWENIRYTVDPMTQNIHEEVVGTFSQYPLRLAWAITVHKSQGLTFEKAAIDISKMFAPGQAYVALSRLTSLHGLKLLESLASRNITIEEAVLDYEKHKSSSTEIAQNIDAYAQEFAYEITRRTFDYRAMYHWNQRMEEELKTAGINSIVAKDKNWLIALISMTRELLSVAVKFQKSIDNFIHANDFHALPDRVEKAYSYFFPRWVDVEKLILKKLRDLSYQNKVKAFESDMREVEEHVVHYLRGLVRLKKLINCIQKQIPLDKTSLSTKEVYDLKIRLASELGGTSDADLKSLAKSTKEKIKEPKKLTHEISMELWQQTKDIKQVASIRKLTFQTVFSHLVKYVEKGELDIEELIDRDKLKLIYTKLQGKNDFESLTAMRSYLHEEFEYHELKLYKIWVSLNIMD